jgi:hypothetical protein
MKGKIVKNTLDSLINVLSKKNTEESKDYSRKKLLKATPFFATGATLHLLNATGSTPIEVLNLFNEYNIDIGNTYLTLYGIGSVLMLSGNDELPVQEELAQYGAEYCPYESFNVANNDLKAKSLQMKVNTLHNLSYKLGNKSFFGRVAKKTANMSESVLSSMGAKSKKLLDFIGKGEFGFELLTHKNNNPRLINELPVPSTLQEVLNPATLDLDNQYKIEERKMVFEIRERAMVKSRESVNERNVFLALVKIIDKIKMDDFNYKDLKIVDKLKKLNKVTSTGSLEKYKGVSELAKLILSEDEDKIVNLKSLEIPNWEAEQKMHERGYHILNELNKISFRNEIEAVKNPMTYREIYRNNLIMAIQFKLRSDYEQDNLKLNNEVPLVKEHFMNTHKNYFKDLIKFRITKMTGVYAEDYPVFKFAKDQVDEQSIEGVINDKVNEINNKNNTSTEEQPKLKSKKIKRN